MYLKKYIMFLLLFLSFSVVVNADEKGEETSGFKDRIGFHTNALSWAMITPNIGVEYDVIHKDIRKTSIFFSGRYNWNSEHKMNGSSVNRYVYNILGVKSELRFYFRTRAREDWEDALLEESKESSWANRMYVRKELLTSKKAPRTYRAYYLAPYLSYDKFTIKLAKTGIQGTAFSAGLSFGYNTALYTYNNGASIDFELGASAGLLYANYEKFEYDREDGCYIAKRDEKGEIASNKGVIPAPLVTDLRIGFVYRFKSIDKQIVSQDQTKLQQLEDLYNNYKSYREKIAKYLNSKSEKYINPDSIKVWNHKVQEANTQIHRINKKYSDVDSTALLTELAMAYPYLEISEKSLRKSQNKKLPNMQISDIEELENSLLNKIIREYDGIKDEDGIESVKTAMLTVYESERQKINNDGDSTKRIPMLSYLVNVVDRINDYSILSHNQKYFIGTTTNKEFVEDVVANLVPKQNLNPSESAYIKGWTSNNNFLIRTEPIYLKNKKVYDAKGQNAITEYENTVKRMALENGYVQPSFVNSRKEEDDEKSSSNVTEEGDNN